MKEIVLDGVIYDLVERTDTKSELDIMKEKFESGDYVCVFNRDGWGIGYSELILKHYKHKLIHNKHKDILEAYLADNSVEIYDNTYDELVEPYHFIENYDENIEYELLKQQYPIFKKVENGIFKQTSNYDCEWVLHRSSESCGNMFRDYTGNDTPETIQYDKERGLYHLQPVWCRLSNDSTRYIDFYDVELGTTRINGIFDYELEIFEPISLEQLKSLPFIWDMYKELLKDCK